LQTAQDLNISLADSVKGSKQQITAIKAEERLRASMAEAAYKAHLEKLKHKECVHDEVLDLTVIDNDQRDFRGTLDSNNRNEAKIERNKRENRKKKKK
jgi:hypothetical protein